MVILLVNYDEIYLYVICFYVFVTAILFTVNCYSPSLLAINVENSFLLKHNFFTYAAHANDTQFLLFLHYFSIVIGNPEKNMEEAGLGRKHEG